MRWYTMLAFLLRYHHHHHHHHRPQTATNIREWMGNNIMPSEMFSCRTFVHWVWWQWMRKGRRKIAAEGKIKYAEQCGRRRAHGDSSSGYAIFSFFYYTMRCRCIYKSSSFLCCCWGYCVTNPHIRLTFSGSRSSIRQPPPHSLLFCGE